MLPLPKPLPGQNSTVLALLQYVNYITADPSLPGNPSF